MRLSTRARYALRFMVTIAKMSGDSHPVSLAKVARQGQLSKRYLEKLVIELKRAGLLRPIPGRTGGYRLARPAEAIRLGQIIEASIGRINIVECVGRPEMCLKADTCECRAIYMLINERISQVLNEYSLADMTEGRWQQRISQLLATEPDLVAGEPPARPGRRDSCAMPGTG